MSSRLVLIDTAPIPGGGELRLFVEGGHYSIKIAGGGDLMSSRMHGSEEALARIACEPVASRAGARILIGGLGMGFTLAAALKLLQADARVVVAELVTRVVDWNRGPLGRHAGDPMDDPRVDVRTLDVAALIRDSAGTFDAILLDVDNGPGGLTQSGNDWLYAREGLLAAFAALRESGVLAIWSAHADRKFSERLRAAGFAVEEFPVRAHGNKGARHLVWRAMKPDQRRTGKRIIRVRPERH